MKPQYFTYPCLLVLLIFSNLSAQNKFPTNGQKFRFKEKNYRFYSPLAYYFLNRAWVDENVKEITILAYKDLHKTHPKRKFLIMDCSKKKGGRIRPHRTHREGLSIDFATPLIRKNKPKHAHHNLGIWHYLMQFDESGNRKWHRNTSIDFDLMAQHILLLDKYARKKGMYVKKVILKINLKEEFFATTNGRKVKRRKIYFARKLPKMVDNVHDDHYHVDFAYLK